MELNLTLLGEMITFIVFIVVTMKFIWPPLMKAMEERRQKIADGLSAAELGKQQLIVVKQQSEEMVKKAKLEAEHIVDHASTRAVKLVDHAKLQGKQETKRIIQKAYIEIEEEVKRTKQMLQSDIVNIAVSIAEKLLEKNIDKSVNQKLFDKLLAEI